MYVGVTTFKNLLGMILMVCGISSVWCFLGAYEDRADDAPRKASAGPWTDDSHRRASAVEMRFHDLASPALAWPVRSWSCPRSAGRMRRPGRIHLVFARSARASAVCACSWIGHGSAAGQEIQPHGPHLLSGRPCWPCIPIRLWARGFESFWMGSTLQTSLGPERARHSGSAQRLSRGLYQSWLDRGTLSDRR